MTALLAIGLAPVNRHLRIPYVRQRRLNPGSMLTSTEIRRERLQRLIDAHGSIAALNVALGWARTDPKLAQIRNANPRPGRDKPYQMGDAMAREIEEKLGLERGLMDTPITYAELHPDDRIAHAMRVMEAMPEWQRDQALKILDTLAQPATGTAGAGK